MDETIYVNNDIPTNEISSDEAARELYRRKRARDSLVEYARAIDIPGAPVSVNPEEEMFKPVESSMALHHIVMLQAIERTVTRDSGRLIIMAPPGSAKSTYVSVVTPSWVMSKWKGSRIILASYASNIAEKHSRKCRALKKDPKENAIWEDRPTLMPDQRAIAQWGLSNNSEFMAAGILAGITGNRANGAIVDDPVKGREEADSETIRTKTMEEFNDSLMTRLLPGGWVIVIATRWHQDDMIGQILPEDYDGQSGMIMCRDGQEWEVLNIPAKAEKEDDPLGRKTGEYLWPEWFPAKHWAKFENNPAAKRTWAALFQQRPKADAGIQFTEDMWQWYDPDVAPGTPDGRPAQLTVYGASDYATKPDGGDFTEHGVAGMDHVGDIWFLDWWFGQKSPDISIAYFIMLVRRWRPLRWAHEGGPIDKAVGPFITKAMADARVFTNMEPMPNVSSKTIKLMALEGYAAGHRVWLPRRRPWALRLAKQLQDFPAAKYDDAADCAGLLARLVDKMLNARIPGQESRKILKPFTGEWLEAEETPDWRKIRYS